eukprot:3742054-Prymnesium_polylepis.1
MHLGARGTTVSERLRPKCVHPQHRARRACARWRQAPLPPRRPRASLARTSRASCALAGSPCSTRAADA